MKKIIIGNWKLNLDHLQGIQLLQKINYSLDKDIEDLGGWLKLINILVMPLLLTGLLLIIRVVRYQDRAN